MTLKSYIFKFVNSGYLDITIFENKNEFLSKTPHTLHNFNKRDQEMWISMLTYLVAIFIF